MGRILIKRTIGRGSEGCDEEGRLQREREDSPGLREQLGGVRGKKKEGGRGDVDGGKALAWLMCKAAGRRELMGQGGGGQEYKTGWGPMGLRRESGGAQGPAVRGASKGDEDVREAEQEVRGG